ncbi:MAG: methyltransferase domain-containing protein [Pseudomonadota bacterium]
MSDKETLKVYSQKADEYADLVSQTASNDPVFADFLAAVPDGGHVLDLGCGPGHYAAAMAKAGLTVTAFDPVPEMIAIAATHNGVTARQAGFDDLSDTAQYDGVWANFSLLHAPRAAVPGHLSRIRAALKPQGRFHIGVKTGSGETRDKIGRLYTYFSETELRGLLQDAGFAVTGRYEGVDKGLSGEDAHWICLAAHA